MLHSISQHAPDNTAPEDQVAASVWGAHGLAVVMATRAPASEVQGLDVSHCKAFELPPAVSSLEALRVLNMQGCEAVLRLPSGITRLTALQRLDLRFCIHLRCSLALALPLSTRSCLGGTCHLTCKVALEITALSACRQASAAQALSSAHSFLRIPCPCLLHPTPTGCPRMTHSLLPGSLHCSFPGLAGLEARSIKC